MAFEGIHPTFRQVPPREPRFSMHAVCAKENRQSISKGVGAKVVYSPSDRAEQL